MWITERVGLVAGGKHGFGLTHPLDCNVYLLRTGEAAVLIDAGAGVEPRLVVERIRSLGVDPDDLTHLLLTHAHADHSGGSHFFRDQFDLNVRAPEHSAPWIESGDLEKTSLRVAREAGVYPEDYELRGCPVSGTYRDGDRLEVGDLVLRVLGTPGHSADHCCFLLEREGERWLFSGDCVFAAGRIILQNTWDCSIADYAASIRRLDDLRIDALFPGHGRFVLQNAHRHVQGAREHFDELSFPPNFP